MFLPIRLVATILDSPFHVQYGLTLGCSCDPFGLILDCSCDFRLPFSCLNACNRPRQSFLYHR